MIDPARVEQVARRPGLDDSVRAWQELDRRRRAAQAELDGLRADRNAANDVMARLDKKSPEFAAARDRLRTLSQDIKAREDALKAIEVETEALLLGIPNAPHASVPDGTS